MCDGYCWWTPWTGQCPTHHNPPMGPSHDLDTTIFKQNWYFNVFLSLLYRHYQLSISQNIHKIQNIWVNFSQLLVGADCWYLSYFDNWNMFPLRQELEWCRDGLKMKACCVMLTVIVKIFWKIAMAEMRLLYFKDILKDDLYCDNLIVCGREVKCKIRF